MLHHSLPKSLFITFINHLFVILRRWTLLNWSLFSMGCRVEFAYISLRFYLPLLTFILLRMAYSQWPLITTLPWWDNFNSSTALSFWYLLYWRLYLSSWTFILFFVYTSFITVLPIANDFYSEPTNSICLWIWLSLWYFGILIIVSLFIRLIFEHTLNIISCKLNE